MNTIDYQHTTPPSFQAKLIQTVMGLLGMKQQMERKMITNGFAEKPAKLPKSLFRNVTIQERELENRKVWTISPINSTSDQIILYFHGGAYMSNITPQHWQLVAQLIKTTNATIVIPDYPLAPAATYKETYDFVEKVYATLTIEYPTKKIVFIGDSAGGGLALGFAQQLRNEQKKQPVELILFSPWLDISMTNPAIQLTVTKDKILPLEGLKNAGQKYAGTADLKDYRLSPIYGDFSGMGRISIFTGTNDILVADARKCKELLQKQHIQLNYFEYPDMFHDWVIITSLQESKDTIRQVAALINN
jgi:acetyl esterase/lipase